LGKDEGKHASDEEDTSEPDKMVKNYVKWMKLLMLSCFVQEAVKLSIIGKLCKVMKKDGTHIHQLNLSKLVDVGLSGGQRETSEVIVDVIAKKIVKLPGVDLGPLLVVPVDRGLRPTEALAAMEQEGARASFSVLGGGHQARARRKVLGDDKYKELIRANPGVTNPLCWVYATGILDAIDEFEVILTYNTFFICTLINTDLLEGRRDEEEACRWRRSFELWRQQL
jgi:hypothetical protein